MIDGATGSDADAAVPPGFVKLIARTWSLQPGQLDTYRCTRIQVPSDMWVSAFQLEGPTGTHHAVLTFDPNDTAHPDAGDYNCVASDGLLNNQMIYAAGIGTQDFALPDGVAIHLAAGQWINLNLHLFDATDNALSGESGVFVKTVPQAQVVHEADMMFSGTFTIDVPSDGNPHVATGGCTAPTDWHVFALWPHMHKTGTGQQFIVNDNGTVSTLLNINNYSFTEQRNYTMEALMGQPDFMVHAGDTITTTCTYVLPAQSCNATTPCSLGTCNMADHLCHMQFGDSSDSEMCFTGMYKYPAGGNTFDCTSN